MYTMEYYSAIKKNEIMPFAATWMDLEMLLYTVVWKRNSRMEKNTKKNIYIKYIKYI